MGKMSELALAVTEVKRCGEALIGISESLTGLFSGNEKTFAQEQPKVEIHTPKKKALTLEAVRTVLAEKSLAGHTAEVRALLEKHGVAKLSEINPAEYPALLAEAEVLGHG